jgi:hypothetical protein
MNKEQPILTPNPHHKLTSEDMLKRFLNWWETQYFQWFKEEGNKLFTEWLEKKKI